MIKTLRFIVKVSMAFSLFAVSVAVFKFGYWLAGLLPTWIGLAAVIIGCIITAAVWTEEEKI